MLQSLLTHSSFSRRHKRQLTDTMAMWQLGPQFLRVDLGSERDVGQVVLYLHTNINPFEVSREQGVCRSSSEFEGQMPCNVWGTAPSSSPKTIWDQRGM